MPRPSMREALIDVGQKMLHQKGYAATPVQDIAVAAGVPKGSFFNHFVTKEAFAAIALERYISAREAALSALMADDSVPLLERISSLMDAMASRARLGEANEGCMVGNFSIEVSGASEPLRRQLSEAFRRWCAPVAAALARAQARGEIALRAEPELVADFILNSLQGVNLRVKVDRSAKPVEELKVVLLDYLSKDIAKSSSHG